MAVSYKGVPMDKPKNIILVVLACAFLLGMPLAACQSGSPVKIDVGGAIAESAVICDHIILDDSWEIRAGSLSGFLDTPPKPRATTAISPPMPMPATYSVYWYNRGTKAAFRADASAPEFVKKAEELVRRHSAESFRKLLIIVLLDSGEVQIWLDARAEPHYKQGFTELLGSIQGVEVPCEPDARQNGGQ